MSIVDIINGIRQSNVTRTVHREPYAGISPTRPELNQSGRSVLITGGGTGAGYAIARSFIQASTSMIIIIGRRGDILDKARVKLEEEARSLGKYTRVIARTCNVVNFGDVDALWTFFEEQNIVVDVYVNNAAEFTEVKPLMELGFNEVWSQMETNVKTPMYFTQRFCNQPDLKQKFILNVTTLNIHSTQHPAVAARPAYTLSKFAGTLFFQYLAQDLPHEKVQVVSFHPGLIYNESWKASGVDPQHFDDDQLTGSFAVWAASKQAAFLHGRTVWVAWDVEELATGELRKRIDEDFYFLRGTIAGLNAGNLA